MYPTDAFVTSVHGKPSGILWATEGCLRKMRRLHGGCCYNVKLLVCTDLRLEEGHGMRPDPSECAMFYRGYIDQIPETDIVGVLQSQLSEVCQFWRTIPEELAASVQPPYTWKLRQVLDHLVDGERIFGYRLHRIARGDATPLPGFDEQHYAVASEEHPAPLSDIIAAFESLRMANLLLIRNLADAAWDRAGTTSGSHITARALIYILAGHVRHHDVVLRKRLADVRPEL